MSRPEGWPVAQPYSAGCARRLTVFSATRRTSDTSKEPKVMPSPVPGPDRTRNPAATGRPATDRRSGGADFGSALSAELRRSPREENAERAAFRATMDRIVDRARAQRTALDRAVDRHLKAAECSGARRDGGDRNDTDRAAIHRGTGRDENADDRPPAIRTAGNTQPDAAPDADADDENNRVEPAAAPANIVGVHAAALMGPAAALAITVDESAQHGEASSPTATIATASATGATPADQLTTSAFARQSGKHQGTASGSAGTPGTGFAVAGSPAPAPGAQSSDTTPADRPPAAGITPAAAGAYPPATPSAPPHHAPHHTDAGMQEAGPADPAPVPMAVTSMVEPAPATPTGLPPVAGPAGPPATGPAGPVADAVPAPPTAPIPHSPAAQLSMRIVPLRLDADGVHRLTVHLHPADLGPVQVVAEIHNGDISVQLSGATDAGNEALRASLDDLRRELDQSGFKNCSLDLGQGSAQQQARQQFASAAAHGRRTADAESGSPTTASAEEPTRRTAGGRIDLHA
jgi:flagellar hook-length control protein FliK